MPVLGLEFHCPLVMLDGLIKLAFLQIAIAQVVVAFLVAGFLLEITIDQLDSLIVLAALIRFDASLKIRRPGLLGKNQ